VTNDASGNTPEDHPANRTPKEVRKFHFNDPAFVKLAKKTQLEFSRRQSI
jgi:hypothetical protein